MFGALVLVAALAGVVWVLYRALKPEAVVTGGSIDLFIKVRLRSSRACEICLFIATNPCSRGCCLVQPDTVQPRARAVDRYRRTYSSPGRQVLIAYGTEYGFTRDVARSLYDALEADAAHSWQVS